MSLLAKNEMFIPTILGLLLGLGIASSDLYVAALPKFSDTLDLTSLESSLTIAFFLGMTGIGTISFLFLRHYFLLKTINTIGLATFALASGFLLVFEGFSGLICCRILQGIAYGMIQATVLAIAKMRFKTNKEGKFSRLSLVSEIICLMAPFTGYISIKYLGWQAPFFVISLLAFALNIPSKFLFENDAKEKLGIFQFIDLLKMPNYRHWAAITALQSGLAWGIICLTPFVLKMHGRSDLYVCIAYSFYSAVYATGCFLAEKEILKKDAIILMVSYCPVLIIPFLFLGTIESYDFFWMAGFLLFGFNVSSSFGLVMTRCTNAAPMIYGSHVGFLTSCLRVFSSGVLVSLSAFFFSITPVVGIVFVSVVSCLIAVLMIFSNRDYTKSSGTEEPEPLPIPTKKAGNI